MILCIGVWYCETFGGVFVQEIKFMYIYITNLVKNLSNIKIWEAKKFIMLGF